MEKSEFCGDRSDPDGRLVTWQKWVQNHKRESKCLAKKLDRPPADLVMNLIDKFREKKEREYVLENAQAHSNTKSIEDLRKQKPQPHRDKDEVSVSLTTLTAPYVHPGRPPVFEHIGVPRYIQKTEKGVIGTPRRRRCDGHEYDEYLRKREMQLGNDIKRIDPYRPSIDNLFVKGQKPKISTSPSPPPPVLVVNSAVEPAAHALSAIYALRINDTVICKNYTGQIFTHSNDPKAGYERCTSWSYYFHVPPKRIGRSELFIQNIGTVTLRYRWKRIKETIPTIPREEIKQVFFFNKNEDLLFPGQSREIVFLFSSDELGAFGECWELSPCDVSFFDATDERLVISLNADAVGDGPDNEKVKTLRHDIERSSKLRTVKTIVRDIVDKAIVPEPEVCPYGRMFLQRDIFVMKNTFCFYHQTRVEELKKYFGEMVEDGEWDLSIRSWRRSSMAKSLEDRMRFYGILKECYRQFLTPWREGDRVADEKIRNVKLLLEQTFGRFDEQFVSLLCAFGVDLGRESSAQVVFARLKSSDPRRAITIHSLFYMSMRSRLCDLAETVAGVVRSLDSYRRINFDLCDC